MINIPLIGAFCAAAGMCISLYLILTNQYVGISIFLGLVDAYSFYINIKKLNN